MTRALHSVRDFFRQPAVREWLLWCLPALLVGLVLRVALTCQQPYAIYHDDSGDLLITPHSWLTQHRWEIHGKKTFLVPLVYTVLAVLKIPILIAVPAIQHLLGLLMIVMVGALCRLWFARWRWFIVPITLVMAVDPYLLWYEHLLMAETPMVFCTVLVALAGTLYTLRQSHGLFALLCVALVLEAGARPEGKLLFGFALFLLILLHARRWRTEWWPIVTLLVLAAATHYVTRTAQAGLLLYTSVARMTPTDLKCAPGFEPFIAPVRESLQDRWEKELSFPKVADRRQISAVVEAYLKSRNPDPHASGRRTANEFCLKVATETCERNFFRLPYYAYQKFRSTAMREAPAGFFDQEWVFTRQQTAFVGNVHTTMGEDGRPGISREITGRTIASAEEYARFLSEKYRVLPWYNTFAQGWTAAVNSVRLPDEKRFNGKRFVSIPRLPVFFIAGGVGLLLILFRRGPLQRFHVAWGLTLLGFFYTIVLTANVRARFRFALEPFWYLYIFLIVDCLLFWILSRPATPLPKEARTPPAGVTSTDA